MARIKSRKSRARYFTPPPDLARADGQIKTPQRCGVLYAKLYSQELDIPIKASLVRKVTGVAERIQSRILSSKEARTRHNQEDKGPDPRGKKRAITRSETAAIADYLNDDDIPLDKKGKPWLDIAQDAGIDLPQTYHFKPTGYRTIEPQSVLRACKEDKGLINAVCKEEKELTPVQAEARLN